MKKLFLSLIQEYILLCVAGLFLIILIGLNITGLSNPLSWLRLLLGFIFVLYVPGYWMLLAVFPSRRQITTLERIGLAFGLSLALISPIALLLNYLPWGIHIESILVSEIALNVIFGVASFLRRKRIPESERFSWSLEIDVARWWDTEDHWSRLLYVILLVVFGIALFSSLAIVVFPKTGDNFTEFYILGPGGMAQDYPLEPLVGEPVSISFGVLNHEGVTSRYHVEVVLDGTVLAQSASFDLVNEGKTEQAITFPIPRVGTDLKVSFLLYRNNDQQPYRNLEWWLNVKQPQ